VQDLHRTFSKRFPIDKYSGFSRLTSAHPPRCDGLKCFPSSVTWIWDSERKL